MAEINQSRYSEGIRRQQYGLTLYAAATTRAQKIAAWTEYATGSRLIEASYGGTPSGRAAAFEATILGRATDNSGIEVSFEDLSYDSASITGWSWNFGDSGTSTQQNPTHVYTVDGTYDVSLTITDAGGSDSTTRLDVVTIERATFIVDFSGTPTSGTEPLSVTFTPIITGQNVITGYEWDFGDGQTSIEQSPTHVYATDGTYTVSLTATEEFGAEETETKSNYITVSNAAALNADFSGTPTTGQVPFAVDFTSSVQGGTGPYTYSWNFGDSTSSTQANPSKTYTTAGTYNVVLTVTDNVAAQDVVTKNSYISATDPPPPPSLSVNFTGNPIGGSAPLNVDFTSQIGGGTPPYTYSWNFGDSGTSTAANPSHTYSGSGAFTVSLQVTDSESPTPQVQTLTRTNYIGVAPSSSNWPTVSVSFTAPTFTPSTNESVNPSTEVTFAWSTTGAATVTLIDSDGPQSVGASGTHPKTPTRSETFHLIVTDSSGLKTVVGRKSVVVKRSLSAVVASGTIQTAITATSNGTGAGVSIPNFWHTPTHTSVQSGDWSSSSTWDAGTVPTESSKVKVASGHNVKITGRANFCATLWVATGGRVWRPVNASSILHYCDLWVQVGATYEMGTSGSPVPREFVALDIVQNRAFDAGTDPNSWGNIILIQGTLDVWGEQRTQIVRAIAHIPAGADFVDVDSVPDWEPGERILIPRSEQGKSFNTGFTTDDEFVTVSHVEDLGNGTARVYLNSTLTYQHPGVVDIETGAVRYRPHIVSLDRNVGWITADPTNTTTRAHAVFDSGATVACHWAVWHGLGRTLRSVVQPTFSSSVARNDDFWRVLQCYKLNGGTFRGCSFIDPWPLVLNSDVLWGIFLNHCVGTIVKDCNVFNWSGAGIVLKGDLGSSCVADHNFVCRIQGSNNRGDGNPLSCEGSGIWMRPQHFVRNNIVAHCLRYGYIMFGYGLSNPSRNEPLKQFDNNEGYSLSTHGFTFWFIQASGTGLIVTNTVRNVLNDLVLWHVATDAVWQYHAHKFDLVRPIFLGDSARLASNQSGKAWNSLDYYLRDYSIVDGEIKGFKVGLEVATIVGNRTIGTQGTVPGLVLIQNMRLYNRRNIMISVPHAGTNGGPKLGPREIRIVNCLFGRTSGPASMSAFDIKACWWDDPDFGNDIGTSLVVEDKIYIEDYNQVADANWRLYRSQQLATFSPVPTAAELSAQFPQFCEGSPVSGLSNQEMFDQHGKKVLNEFCPADAITHPGGQIIGLVKAF